MNEVQLNDGDNKGARKNQLYGGAYVVSKGDAWKLGWDLGDRAWNTFLRTYSFLLCGNIGTVEHNRPIANIRRQQFFRKQAPLPGTIQTSHACNHTSASTLARPPSQTASRNDLADQKGRFKILHGGRAQGNYH